MIYFKSSRNSTFDYSMLWPYGDYYDMLSVFPSVILGYSIHNNIFQIYFNLKKKNYNEMIKITKYSIIICLIVYINIGVIGFLNYKYDLKSTVLSHILNDLKYFSENNYNFEFALIIILIICFIISAITNVPVMFQSLNRNILNVVIFIKRKLNKKKNKDLNNKTKENIIDNSFSNVTINNNKSIQESDINKNKINYKTFSINDFNAIKYNHLNNLYYDNKNKDNKLNKNDLNDSDYFSENSSVDSCLAKEVNNNLNDNSDNDSDIDNNNNNNEDIPKSKSSKTNYYDFKNCALTLKNYSKSEFINNNNSNEFKSIKFLNSSLNKNENTSLPINKKKVNFQKAMDNKYFKGYEKKLIMSLIYFVLLGVTILIELIGTVSFNK